MVGRLGELCDPIDERDRRGEVLDAQIAHYRLAVAAPHAALQVLLDLRA